MDVLFFDLFFTLIRPDYLEEQTEFQVLNLSKEEWEKYAEDKMLYTDRTLGRIKSKYQMISAIFSCNVGG